MSQNLCPIARLPYEQSARYGGRTCFEYQDYGSAEWRTASWRDFASGVRQVSRALVALGVGEQECIGVFAQNAVPYIYTDFGAYGVRAATVPFYATSSEQQLQYIVGDAAIRLLFVGEQQQYDVARRALPLCPTLQHIVVYDPAVVVPDHDGRTMRWSDFLALGTAEHDTVVDSRLAAFSDDDIVNILYTSGTTGEPKGVVLTAGQYHAALQANGECVPITERDRVITFLPITHIFERGWDVLALTQGCTLIVNTDPHRIQQSMRETCPTCMSAVPRFWEKVYAGVQEQIDRAPRPLQRLFLAALRAGREYNVARRRGPLATLRYRVLDRLVLRLVRKRLGLLRPNIFPTAGAVVSTEVETFVHSLGLEMIVGYGLTESLATVSCDHKGEPYTVGSVGRPISSIAIRIDPDTGEVLLKGPTITRGYYKRDELNRQTFTDDGYFRTGDAGYMRGGELFLTERLKDLYKTSNGKYVAPQAVEAKLLVDKYVEQVVVVAEERKFVSALVVPAYATLEEYARDHGIACATRDELCRNEKIHRMLSERIATLQQGLAGYEQVKRFTLLTEPFTMESGCLTNTLKTRRAVIAAKYKDEIERMYTE